MGLRQTAQVEAGAGRRAEACALYRRGLSEFDAFQRAGFALSAQTLAVEGGEMAAAVKRCE